MISLKNICSSLKIDGKDSLNFLNNLIISDLNTWPSGRFIYSAICNPKGRIICSLWINKINDNSFIVLYPENMKQIESFLKLRTFRMKVTIDIFEKNLALDNNQIIIGDFEASENDADSFQLALNHLGLPWIDQANTEKFIPQHVNLDQTDLIMNFKKGCYPGQEIIARIKFLGKIKKRMTLHVSESSEEVNEMKRIEVVSNTIFNASKDQFETQIIQRLDDEKK